MALILFHSILFGIARKHFRDRDITGDMPQLYESVLRGEKSINPSLKGEDYVFSILDQCNSYKYAHDGYFTFIIHHFAKLISKISPYLPK